MKRIVLDSSALVAHFASEPGGEVVRDLLREARRRKVTLSISAVNLGEAIYVAARKRGAAGTESLVRWLPQLPLTVSAAEKDDAVAAANLKIKHHLPYADCFVAALALRLQAAVITSDRHFETVADMMPVRWI
jgi:predicted nucleic acid-binding protein